MIKPLEYYSTNGTHLLLSNYTIDTNGVVRNDTSGVILHTRKNKAGYKVISVNINLKK